MSEIVLRVRLIGGDHVDVTYEEADAVDSDDVTEHAIATLAQDTSALRTRHGDRLVVLYGRGVAGLEVAPRGAVVRRALAFGKYAAAWPGSRVREQAAPHERRRTGVLIWPSRAIAEGGPSRYDGSCWSATLPAWGTPCWIGTSTLRSCGDWLVMRPGKARSGASARSR